MMEHISKRSADELGIDPISFEGLRTDFEGVCSPRTYTPTPIPFIELTIRAHKKAIYANPATQYHFNERPTRTRVA